MGEPLKPIAVKLVIGLIFNNKISQSKISGALTRRFGPLDFTSKKLPFDKTNYYEKELGPNLTRSFVSFKRLVRPEALKIIKLTTNRLEKKFSSKEGCRCVNIDPGYMSLSKFVLATTKNFSHRIYVGRGIFEEITLFFQNGSFQPGRWTYPDYRSQEYIEILNKIRLSYYNEVRQKYGLSELYRCV